MRSFQAIGVADAAGAFQSDMVKAVESVVGPVHVECVSARPSSGGKYTAVRVGPVHVQNADQVVAIFAAIKEAGGDRLKWYM
jgi:putative lipoic acid-binding regulatory protein